MLDVTEVLSGLEVAMNPDFHDVVSESSRHNLNGPINQASYPEDGEETIPKPKN